MISPSYALIPKRLRWTFETIANSPFGTASDYSILDEMKTDTVREYIRDLRRLGYVNTKRFGTLYLKTAPRTWVTTRGANSFLQNSSNEDDIVTMRRNMAGLGVMARRADVAALVTRLAAKLTPYVKDPGTVFIHYLDSPPLDAVIQYQGNRLVGVLYAGPNLPRRSVWKRLKKLKELPITSRYLTLILAPTIHDRNVVFGQLSTLGDLRCVVAYTYAAVADTVAPWRVPDKDDWASYRDLGEEKIRSLVSTRDKSPVRIDDLELRFLGERSTPVRQVSERVDLNLPPLAKELAVLLGQWGLLARPAALPMLGVSSPQMSGLLRKLRACNLVSTERVGGYIYYSLSDTGISYRATHDRCDVNAMLNSLSPVRRWSVPAGAPLREDIRSRIGSYVRQRLANLKHDDYVSVYCAQCKTITWPSEYEIGDVVPSTRSWSTFVPGKRLSTLQSALTAWRERPTDRPNVLKGEWDSVGFRPDAILFLHSPTHASLMLFLEVELTASTPLAWQDRLELYMLYSLVRPSNIIPLFIVPSEAHERQALRTQSRWVQADQGRRWPVAVTTMERIRANLVSGAIWRVDAGTAECHTLLALPTVLQRR